MVITEVSPLKGLVVNTDQGEFIRFGPGSWYLWMGESLEPTFFNEDELEEAFQVWTKTPL